MASNDGLELTDKHKTWREKFSSECNSNNTEENGTSFSFKSSIKKSCSHEFYNFNPYLEIVKLVPCNECKNPIKVQDLVSHIRENHQTHIKHYLKNLLEKPYNSSNGIILNTTRNRKRRNNIQSTAKRKKLQEHFIDQEWKCSAPQTPAQIQELNSPNSKIISSVSSDNCGSSKLENSLSNFSTQNSCVASIQNSCSSSPCAGEKCTTQSSGFLSQTEPLVRVCLANDTQIASSLVDDAKSDVKISDHEEVNPSSTSSLSSRNSQEKDLFLDKRIDQLGNVSPEMCPLKPNSKLKECNSEKKEEEIKERSSTPDCLPAADSFSNEKINLSDAVKEDENAWWDEPASLTCASTKMSTNWFGKSKYNLVSFVPSRLKKVKPTDERASNGIKCNNMKTSPVCENPSSLSSSVTTSCTTEKKLLEVSVTDFSVKNSFKDGDQTEESSQQASSPLLQAVRNKSDQSNLFSNPNPSTTNSSNFLNSESITPVENQTQKQFNHDPSDVLEEKISLFRSGFKLPSRQKLFTSLGRNELRNEELRKTSLPNQIKEPVLSLPIQSEIRKLSQTNHNHPAVNNCGKVVKHLNGMTKHHHSSDRSNAICSSPDRKKHQKGCEKTWLPNGL